MRKTKSEKFLPATPAAFAFGNIQTGKSVGIQNLMARFLTGIVSGRAGSLGIRKIRTKRVS